MSGTKYPPGDQIFFKNIAKLAAGTTLSQVFCILASPIITRLFSPEAFGLSALFASIAGIILIIISLRYELAIMLPKKDEEAANLLGISLSFVFLICVLAVPLISLGGPFILALLEAPDLGPYMWLLVPFLFFNGLSYSFSNWIARKKSFGLLSVVRAVNSFLTTALILGAGFAGYATGGSMIEASVIGFAVTSIALGAKILADDGAMLKRSITMVGFISGINRYKKFPLIDTWGALLHTASWQAPTFLLSAFFSPVVVGYYALGLNVLGVPMSLVGEAIGKVFFQKAAEDKSDLATNLSNIIESTLVELAIIGFFPLMVLTMMGKEIFIFLFGLQWADAGVYTQILALWIFIVFITDPISSLFSVFEKQESYLVFKFILLITRCGSIILGAALGDVYISLILFSITGALTHCGMTYWMLHKAEVPIQRIFNKFVKIFSYSIPAIIAISLAKWSLVLSPEMIILVSILMAVPYYALAIREDEMLRYLLYSYIRAYFKRGSRQNDD